MFYHFLHQFADTASKVYWSVTGGLESILIGLFDRNDDENFPVFGKIPVSHILFTILSKNFLALSGRCFSISYMIESSPGAVASDEISASLNSLKENLALYASNLSDSIFSEIWASLTFQNFSE